MTQFLTYRRMFSVKKKINVNGFSIPANEVHFSCHENFDFKKFSLKLKIFSTVVKMISDRK